MRRPLTAHLLNWGVIEIEPDAELHTKGGFILHGISKRGESKRLVEGERIYTARVTSHRVDALKQGAIVETVGGSLYRLGQKQNRPCIERKYSITRE